MDLSSAHYLVAPIIGLTILYVPVAQAVGHRIECPPEVAGDNLRVITPPVKWRAHIPGTFRLRAAGPMDGPPAELGILQENDSPRRVGKSTVLHWDMSGVFSAGKWMACYYGPRNDIILGTKIDEKTTLCVITRTERPLDRVDIDIRCDW